MRCGYWGVPNNVTAAITRWSCGVVVAVVMLFALTNIIGGFG